MDILWIFYISTFIGTTTILIWVFESTPVFRTAKSWVRTEGPEKYRHWIRYATIKRNLTPLDIAMNAIHDSSFSENDLEKLNALFAKLEQPSAKLIDPQTGDLFVSTDMKHVGDEFKPKRGGLYVLNLLSNGVAWKGKVLKEANVTKCSSDRLLLHNLALQKMADKKIAESFLDFLQQDGELTLNFELSFSKVQGFIDTKISESQAGGLLSWLMESDPEDDLTLIRPASNQKYDDDTMNAAGDQPGHRCKVVAVIHPGLKRKSDRAWCVKALVTIQNLSRSEA